MAPCVKPLEQRGVRGVADRIAARKEAQRRLKPQDRGDRRDPLDRDLGRDAALDPSVLRPRDACSDAITRCDSPLAVRARLNS